MQKFRQIREPDSKNLNMSQACDPSKLTVTPLNSEQRGYNAEETPKNKKKDILVVMALNVRNADTPPPHQQQGGRGGRKQYHRKL